MSDSIRRDGVRPGFWETVPLEEMSQREWEALCDGCGRCCLNKLEDDDTADIAYTRIACRLLDDDSCRCAQYDIRKNFVPDCVVLTPQNLAEISYWMPKTCAYRLLHEKKPLYDWHPLISGTHQTVHEAGISVKGWSIPEFEVDEDDWENYIIDDKWS